MFGLLNLNKPSGMTSRDLVNVVQRIVRPVKVGHAGTLDPMATGVLVVCLGKATRLVPFLHNERKTYRAEFTLGQTSDTDDSTGDIAAREVAAPPTLPVIEQELQSFTGRINQVPPQFSAVHVEGRRAYAMARAGQSVDLEAKSVDVHRLDVVSYEWPLLTLEIECGSGTYIRSIARDLGHQLGCGGLMSGLERTAVGTCHVAWALQPDQLNASLIASRLISPLVAVRSLRRFCCDSDGDLEAVVQGKPIPWDSSRVTPPNCEVSPPKEHARMIAVVTEDDRLICLAERSKRNSMLLQPRQVFAAEISS